MKIQTNLNMIKTIQISLMAGLCTILYGGEKVYMPFFEMINIHEDYQYSTARLFQSYVDGEGRYELIIPPKPDSQVEQPSLAEIRAQAREQNAPSFIVGNLNRVWETVIVSVSLYNTESGKSVWYDRLKAASPEDLDPVLQKIALALGTDRQAAEDGNIYSVTNHEAKKLRRIRTSRAFGVSLGSALLPLGDFSEEFSTAGGGIYWAYDARHWLFEVDAQSHFIGGNNLSFLSIGVYRPVLPEDLTPFWGGGLGISRMSVPGEKTESYSKDYSGSGLLAYLGGGMMVNRTSNVNIRLHARYFIGAFTLDNPERSIPHGALANLEISFGK